jgi:cytochrome c5
METRLKVRVRGAAAFAGTAAVIFAAVAALAGAQSPARAAAADASGAQSAPGPGRADTIDMVHAKATFVTLCSKCHDLGPINAQRHDRAGWSEVLDRMSGFGLVASDEEIKEVLDYLVARQAASQ